MSETEKRIAKETAAEIARLEGQIKALRQFQKLIDPKGLCRKKRKYRRSKITAQAIVAA